MTPTPTPHSLENASMNVTNSFASGGDLTGPLVIILYAILVLLAANFVAPWLARSQLASRVGRSLALSLHYAIKGVASLVVIGITAAPIWFVSQAEPGTRSQVLQVFGLIVAGYLALVVVGFVADRAVTRFIEAHPEYESWGDIWGGEDEELPDAEPS